MRSDLSITSSELADRDYGLGPFFLNLIYISFPLSDT